jgi:hypothetical protein
MKNIDLDSDLKALRVPERGQEFWDAFPGRVLAELRATPVVPPVRAPFLPWLVRGFGVALACLAVGLCLGQSRLPKRFCSAVLKNERELRQTVRQFPRHVCALMQDEHGLRSLVEDQQ